jgi:signal transduction histidine kinase
MSPPSDLLLQAVPAFVIALDAGGRIAFWNRCLEEATGFTADEMRGKDGRPWLETTGPARLPTKDGNEIVVDWRRARVAGPEGWTYAVGVDVTGGQQLQRRALRAERLAAVGRMVTGFAHEVRNPLNAALLQLALLGRRIERGESAPDAVRPLLGTVQSELQRIDRLVNDFLAFAQPRPPLHEPVDPADRLRAVVEALKPAAEAAGVSIELELGPSPPGFKADPERLREALYNLGQNAVEAMARGGTLTFRTRLSGPWLEIDVEDTGAGIADDKHIFDAFYTTKPQGTGLGLTIVHRIVSDHDGHVRVRSRPGSTCFTLALPATGS